MLIDKIMAMEDVDPLYLVDKTEKELQAIYDKIRIERDTPVYTSAIDIAFSAKCPKCGHVVKLSPDEDMWSDRFYRDIDHDKAYGVYAKSYFDVYCRMCGKHLNVTF